MTISDSAETAGNSAPAFADPTMQKIADFLAGIGIKVRSERIPEITFLPGLKIDGGALVVDEALLPYPGDMLHEAGHIAVAAPERRRELHINAGNDPAEEMMAISWSWAAARHIGIEPTVLFHEGGYRGWSPALIENFTLGRYFAVPMLQWVGMTADPARAQELGIEPYPHMIHWLRT